MYTCDITQRIRYGETDQMGYVYYGRYAEFYEIGRTELIRFFTTIGTIDHNSYIS